MSTPKKVLFLGNQGTGKTHVIRQLLGTCFQRGVYFATMGTDIHTYISPSGSEYSIWDCAGKLIFKGKIDDYCIGADIAFIFADMQVGPTSCDSWREEVKWFSPTTQIYYVVKSDLDFIKGILN